MKGKYYVLTQDNDCHWYVVEEEKLGEFEKWASSDDELDEVNERIEARPEMPEGVEPVGGSPTLVRFKNYVLD